MSVRFGVTFMGCYRVSGWEALTPWEVLPQHVQNYGDHGRGMVVPSMSPGATTGCCVAVVPALLPGEGSMGKGKE